VKGNRRSARLPGRLKAVIERLAALKQPSRVDLTSNSQYVLKGLKE
jgi:hypothetical protein